MAETTPEQLTVSGFAHPPFDGLPEAFGRIAAVVGGGAALSIHRDGEHLVDLSTEGSRRSLHLLFSVTKVLTAVLAAQLHERGELDLDEPLGTAWPAFARAETRAITTRSVLSHRSGLASLDADLSLDALLAGADDDEIERQRPYWEPGTEHGYHAFTFGTLVGGLMRRVTGHTVRELFASRIGGPLGLDLWVGAPETALPRVAPIGYEPRISLSTTPRPTLPIPPSSTGRLLPAVDVYNDRRVWQAGWPSTGGIGDARSLSAFLDSVLGGRTIGLTALRELTRELSRGPDAVLGFPTRFGSGVQLPFPSFPMLGRASFGHEAAGGSAIVADPDRGLSVAWTVDRYPALPGSHPAMLAILPSILSCLDGDGDAR